MNKIRKRFVAGAVCPKCHSMDTLALSYEEQGEKVACVTCDYHQSQKEPPYFKHESNSPKIIHRFPLK